MLWLLLRHIGLQNSWLDWGVTSSNQKHASTNTIFHMPCQLLNEHVTIVLGAHDSCPAACRLAILRLGVPRGMRSMISTILHKAMAILGAKWQRWRTRCQARKHTPSLRRSRKKERQYLVREPTAQNQLTALSSTAPIFTVKLEMEMHGPMRKVRKKDLQTMVKSYAPHFFPSKGMAQRFTG